LIKRENKEAEYILDYYLRRNPYSIYEIKARWEMVDEETIQHFWNPEERMFLERSLVKLINIQLDGMVKLRDGDCLVYAMPSPANLYKEMQTYVVYLDRESKPRVERMNLLAAEKLPYEQMALMKRTLVDRIIKQRDDLIQKYQALWNVS